jgi:hypothetical protein
MMILGLFGLLAACIAARQRFAFMLWRLRSSKEEVMPKPTFTDFVVCDEFEVAVDRLCFGRPAARICKSKGTRAPCLYRFPAGQVFAIIWQRWHSDGRQHRAIAIVETSDDPTIGVLLPSISRAVTVHAMVDQGGPAGQGGGVDRLLLLIQSIERLGVNPADVPASYWRPASFQIMIRQRPPMPPTKAA